MGRREKLGSCAVFAKAPAHAMVSCGADLALQRCPHWARGWAFVPQHWPVIGRGDCPGKGAWPWTLADGSSWGELAPETSSGISCGRELFSPEVKFGQ